MNDDPWSETADDGAADKTSSGDLAAWAAAVKDLPSGQWPPPWREVSRRLATGASLEQALAALETRLPGHLGELVAAGLRDGTLGAVLEQFARQQRTTAELRRKVRLTLAAPAALLAGALLLVLLVARLVVPGMQPVLRKLEVELPEQARLLVWLSTDGAWTIWLAVLVLSAAALMLWLSSRSARLGNLARAVSGMSASWRWIGLAEWSRLLALLLRQRTPLPRALLLTAEGLGDAEMAVVSRSLSTRTAAGGSFAEAVAVERALPPTLRNILDWGERQGTLADSLQAVGDLCEGRVRMQLSLWETVLPPLACLITAAAVTILFSAMHAALLAAIKILQALA